jgi:hypothetical protein
MTSSSSTSHIPLTTALIYREEKVLIDGVERIVLRVEGIVISREDPIAGAAYRRADLLITLAGTRSHPSDGPVSEEGDRLTTSFVDVQVLGVKHELSAPRHCVLAADEWFRTGPAFLRARAAQEAAESGEG